MKHSFTNVQTFPSENGLSPEEIAALQCVVRRILDLYYDYPDMGTIILDGQRKGEAAQCIMRMNLEKGMYTTHVAGVREDRTSDELAEMSIDKVLAWPENILSNSALTYRPEAKFFGELPTSTYRGEGKEKVLVLNTIFGRFIICAPLAWKDCNGELLESSNSYYFTLLMGVAMALGRMRGKDPILQRSIREFERYAGTNYDSLEKDIGKMFGSCELPELAAWKKWQDNAMAKDDLKLFFE